MTAAEAEAGPDYLSECQKNERLLPEVTHSQMPFVWQGCVKHVILSNFSTDLYPLVSRHHGRMN